MILSRRCFRFLPLAAVLLLTLPSQAQAAIPAANPQTAPCCGVITPEGHRMMALLDSLDVEHHWLPNEQVNWKTGDPTHNGQYIPHDTHCSAFAGAVSLRLHVYLLRPPEHKTILLASAQGHWLADHAKAGDNGWVSVTPAEAQRLANLGEFVVVNYISPNEHKPGHIAIIRPSEKTAAQLAQDGPEITQAGGHNYADNIAAQAFTFHPDAWPNGVRYYAHTVDWSAVKDGAPLPAEDAPAKLIAPDQGEINASSH